MDIRTVIMTVPPLLFSIVLHEVAHAWVANRLGDPTARLQGRITLNPIVHIDPFMSLILPALLIFMHSPIVFGGAKPVPVDARYFKNPRRDMVLVALAGPVSNICLAILLIIIARSFGVYSLLDPSSPPYQELFAGWVVHGTIINVVLAVFNMLPFPPLDGGRITVGLLPLNLAYRWSKIEPYGFIIVIILLSLGVVDLLLQPVFHFTIKLLGLGPFL